MTLFKNVLLWISNLAIIICVAGVFYVYSLPWVEGSGSVLKPVDDMTGIFQAVDPTNLIKFSIETPKKVTDTVFRAMTFGRTRQHLSGWEIPLSNSGTIKKNRPFVYLLYLPLALALVCIYLSVKGNRRPFYDLGVVFLGLVVVAATVVIRSGVGHENLFIMIQSADGFEMLILCFVGIGVAAAFKLLIHFIERTCQRFQERALAGKV